jgi:hypothetical protein
MIGIFKTRESPWPALPVVYAFVQKYTISSAIKAHLRDLFGVQMGRKVIKFGLETCFLKSFLRVLAVRPDMIMLTETAFPLFGRL